MGIKKFIQKKASNFINTIKFCYDYIKFGQLQTTPPRLPMSWFFRRPILNENTKDTYFDAHYIYHPAWAARVLAEIAPLTHIDISSSLHFCSIVSSFINIEFFDYRPAQLNLDNLSCKYANILDLPFSDNSVLSLSCMHVIEHIGLGRYGDPLDPDGDLKAIVELKRVIKPGGNLIIVVPVGKPRIQFNAHRIYDATSFSKYFDNLELIEFAIVTDSQQFFRHKSPGDYKEQKYACGCFHFRKNDK